MPTNTMIALDKITVASATSSITFTSIPQTYTDLVIIASLTADSDNTNLILRFNGDSSLLYSQTYMGGTGSTVTTTRESNQGRILLTGVTATPNSTNPATFVGSVMNYANTNINKKAIWRWNVPSATYPGVQANVGLYRSSSGINQISLIMTTGNITAGSTFTLHGIKSASTTSPLATGGLVYEDDNYYWHTFASSGTFTPSAALTNVDYLVIAGGGGSGGNAICGGGGAGGYKTTVGTSGGNTSALSKISLNSGTAYTITVGAGGSSTSNGSSSSISGTGLTTISTDGGGYGNNGGGANGGSGAGGGAYNNDPTYPAGSGQTGQGFAGGIGLTDRYAGAVWRVAGGGGGAGGTTVTKNSSTIEPSVFANGGPGLVSAIDGVARGGGGGGGLQYGDQTQTVGGFGGGGTGGGYVIRPVNGTPNTGGGGGGVGYGGIADNYPSSGGSGVVIIRYPKA